MSDLDKKNNNIIPVLLLLVAAVFSLFSVYYKSFLNNEETPSNLEAQEETTQYLGETQYLDINPTEEYNYKSKQEIYSIRKEYVSNSIFASRNYTPREEVFGQIGDGKPWWGLKTLRCMKKDRTKGDSAVSRFINNPNQLINIMIPYGVYKSEATEHYCNSEYSKFIPTELGYDEYDSKITAKYNLHREATGEKSPLMAKYNRPFYIELIGLNARDFGYDYIMLSHMNNVSMLDESNASKHVYRLLDYIHVGNSCGVDGGCNNISPENRELMFYVTDLPASIDVKLWKNYPENPEFDKPDFKYSIIFEEINE